jgi:N-ethylmaleimide reductase
MSALSVLKPFAGAGGITYKNRIGFAPMTRGRADKQTGTVKDIHAVYYSERASAGIQFTEGTLISRQGHGWSGAPGIYTPEQIEAWKLVTSAVHKEGGLIFCQIAHCGRGCHSDVTGTQIVSASAIAVSGEATVLNHEKKPFEVPHALTAEEIKAVIADFVTAAKNSIEAGFDGVQLHSANGFLIDQFIQSCSNKRTDDYGGSIENCLRFLKEILAAVGEAIGKERVWVRFSPNSPFQDMGSEDNIETFDAAIKLAASFEIGGVEVMDGLGFGFHQKTEPYTLVQARAAIAAGNPAGTTALAGNVGYTLETAEKAITEGRADIINFGRAFLSNPDLPERFRDGVPLAADPPYPDWWITDTAEGYITFPRATAKAAA